jgi:uncharacterized protein
MNLGLDKKTMDRMRVVFSNHPEIMQVIIFGSRAKGNFKEGSDIDFALIGPDIHRNLISTLQQEIDKLNTPYKVDILIFHEIESPELKAHIERVGKVFY